MIERDAPGGQAGQSARIENYLGFPNGLSGADLSHRATTQARRLGAEMVLARHVEALEPRGSIHAVRFDDGTEIEARAVIVATGVSYRLLDADGLAELTGRGVYYGASASDARGDRGRRRVHRRRGQLGRPGRAAPRAVRQAGGDAGARRLARGGDVAVPRRAGRSPPTTSRCGCAPRSSRGGGDRPSRVARRSSIAPPATRRRSTPTGCTRSSARCRSTDWLGDCVARDEHGFVLTGPDVAALDGDDAALAACRGRRSCSRPACPACSRPATSVGVDEAGRVGGRRGVERDQQRAPVPGDGVTLADDLRGAFLTERADRRAARRTDGRRRGASTFAADDELFREGRTGRLPLDPARRPDRTVRAASATRRRSLPRCRSPASGPVGWRRGATATAVYLATGSGRQRGPAASRRARRRARRASSASGRRSAST